MRGMDTQALMETTLALNTDAMKTWSDDKRKDFCKLFEDRSQTSRYILLMTASNVFEMAKRKKFVSDKHERALLKSLNWATHNSYNRATISDLVYHKSGRGMKRDVNDLNDVATQRASDIVKNLPPLAKAIQVIDQPTADKIDRIEALTQKGKKMQEELDEICGTLDMADLDQNMTVGAFRQMVKDREARRVLLITKLNEITKDIQELDTQVSKFLYAGIPGLSEAVVDTVRELIEQANALEVMGRRVEEQVQFGDSEAALTLLSQFEKDESTVSITVKDRFKEALKQLNVAKTTLKKAKTK